MTEKQLKAKRSSLKGTCIYGLSHFCDGTPNKSEDVTAKKKMPCPMKIDCKHRRNPIIDRLNEVGV